MSYHAGGPQCLCVCVSVCGLSGTDDLSRWWSAVLAVAAHWLTVTDDESSLVAAQRFYAVVDSMPKALHNSESVDTLLLMMSLHCV